MRLRSMLLLVASMASWNSTASDPLVQGVLIFKTARSGSSWLGGLLDGLKKVRFYGEVIEWKTCQFYSRDMMSSYLRALLTQADVPKLGRENNTQRAVAFVQGLSFERTRTCEERGAKEIVVRGAFASPKGDCAMIPYGHVVRTACSKVVLFLRTNVVKMAAARLRDNKVGRSPKICHRRRLGQGSNLPKNCEYTPIRLNVSVGLFVNFIRAKAIQDNERLVDNVHAALGDDIFLTMTYEKLQSDRVGELERFKRFVGLPTFPDEELLDEKLVKASPDDPRTALSQTLWESLDETFRNFSSADDQARSEATAISECLVDMLHASGPTDFNYYPCVPSFSTPQKSSALSDHHHHHHHVHREDDVLSGLRVASFEKMYRWAAGVSQDKKAQRQDDTVVAARPSPVR